MTDYIWEQDIHYSLQDIKKFIKNQTGLDIAVVKKLGNGFDNEAFLVNDRLVFRFVRRKEGQKFMKHELLALPLLETKLSLKIPVILYQGCYQDQWLWCSYEIIGGQMGEQLSLTSTQRKENIPRIAKFLRCLHALDVEPFETAGVPTDFVPHMDLSYRVPFAYKKLDIVKRFDLDIDEKLLVQIIKSMENINVDQVKKLVHGDFKSSHMVFDRGLVKGVIDWGDVHLGHPSCDLSIVYGFFPPILRELFWKEYGKISALWKQLARFRALFHNLAITEYAFIENQASLLKESIQALNWAYSRIT